MSHQRSPLSSLQVYVDLAGPIAFLQTLGRIVGVLLLLYVSCVCAAVCRNMEFPTYERLDEEAGIAPPEPELARDGTPAEAKTEDAKPTEGAAAPSAAAPAAAAPAAAAAAPSAAAAVPTAQS